MRLLDYGSQNGQRKLLTLFPNGALHTLLLSQAAHFERRDGTVVSISTLQRGDQLLLQGGTTDAPLVVRDLTACATVCANPVARVKRQGSVPAALAAANGD